MAKTDPRSITRDGVCVMVGQFWRNLDKRSPYLKEVVEVIAGRARMGGSPSRWVSIRRMHTHSTGWKLET